MKVALGLMASAAVLALAACSAGKTPAPAATQPTFHEVMKDKVDAPADALWEIANAAISDDAGIDPAKMTDAQWTALADKAEAVRQGALEIARMDPIVVVKPGVTIADEGVEGGHSAVQVQQQIDADPAQLRAMADGLASHMADIVKAAKAHDAAAAGPLIDQLDGVCEGCHLEFWYPSQKALIEQYGIKAR